MKKTLRVLNIEDSKDDSELIRLQLAEDGYDAKLTRVETAEQLEVALKSETSWDVILSDYSLPNLTAPIALTIVKKSGLDVPFIVISGTIGEERAVSVLRAGAKDFIFKDNLTRLAPIIERELREFNSRRLKSRVDRAYRESETRYRQIVDLAREGIWVFKENGETTFVNKALANMLGYHEQEILHKSITEYISSTEVPVSDFLNHIGKKTEGQYEVKFVGTNGVEIESVVSVSIMESKGERNFLAMVTDTTNRQLLSEAGLILSSSLDYTKTLEAVAQLVCSRLADWCHIRIVLPNSPIPQTVALIHKDPEKIKFAHDYESKFPIDWEGQSITARVFRDRATIRIPVFTDEMLHKVFGHHEQVEMAKRIGLKSTIVVPINSRNKVKGILSLLSSESNRHYSEEDQSLAEQLGERIGLAIDNAILFAELEAANKAKDQFLATLSHELRTPLNVILGWVELLKNESLDPAAYDQAVETLDRNAKIQKELIEDLLDVSRIITGKFSLNSELLHVNPLLASIVESNKIRASQKKIELKSEIEKATFHIKGDQIRLTQVLANLIDNALKFTPPTGAVTIKAYRSNSWLELVVQDTGHGIDAAFLPHVFDTLRQEDMGTTRSHGGLGLGLSISRHIVELHGGHISVKSPGRDKGCTFIICLPLVDEAPLVAPQTIKEQATRPLQDLKILVVDDSPDVLELICLWLKRAGANYKAAGSAKEAFNELKTFQPEILVSDIGMPGEDGYSLIRRVRTLSKEDGGSVKAIALTAYAREEEKSLAISAGFDWHLAKPTTEKVLINTILAEPKI